MLPSVAHRDLIPATVRSKPIEYAEDGCHELYFQNSDATHIARPISPICEFNPLVLETVRMCASCTTGVCIDLDSGS
jgi:hypothetical protein